MAQADTVASTNATVGSGKTHCPDYILKAIYGSTVDANPEDKNKAYNHSLTRWWKEYAFRKNDEEEEHVADSLLYDRNHLPRAAPPPECVHEARALQQAAQQLRKQETRPLKLELKAE
ncbi:hypothetical protein WJX72_008054 [[Myrmecia] bisecta]|uniref:Uncharacterized protein n=1 Tax=[Myrmecia] bisecta TaxID=41462 RepID=A0AAW1PPW1_9CHLO